MTSSEALSATLDQDVEFACVFDTEELQLLKCVFVMLSSSVSQSGPYRPPGGVEDMQGGGRRVRLEWEAYITV
ncbi:hypothetical protein FHG87_008419 [Trinorchestia longiramus]|nr:hypothetical protein FHG87_008419 [Trinorchestia longiramus]